ncbi:MAG: hypothetical protein Q9160_000220 [Pyrenula sp. 1 TL-2023]
MQIHSLSYNALEPYLERESGQALVNLGLPMESQYVPSERDDIDRIIRQVYQSPSISVGKIDALPGHLHRIYRITLSSTLPTYHGASLMLKLPPHTGDQQLSCEREALRTDSLMLGVVGADGVIPTPDCIRSEMEPYTIDSQFLLTTCLPGSCLRDVDSTFSTYERADIDRQVGFFMYKISRQRLDVFGYPLQVANGIGFNSWRLAFTSMIDSLLVDAEDRMLSLPYAHIKHHVSRLSHVLDGISEARLVMINLGSPDSIFVDEATREVTGVLDFSSVVWGDSLFARMFTDPSPAMIEGFGRTVASYGPERLRRTLYDCYHALRDIVTNYVRHSDDETEMIGRRLLTKALKEMAATGS